MQLIGPVINSDLLFDRIVARVKEKLNKSTPNKDWTNTLKYVFGDEARSIDPTCALASSVHGGEILLDLAWRQSSSPDILLAMESEWGNEVEVVHDFSKLMNVKAGLKVMIFSTMKDDDARRGMQAAIEKILISSAHHITGEEYLLFNFPCGLPGMAYCSRYIVPRDGKQDRIEFEDKRQASLWD